jgi:hypothetical protein
VTTVTDPSPAAWPETSQDHPFGDPPCWANPLTRAERRELSLLLADACKRLFEASTGPSGPYSAQLYASVECSDLHLDVTERAEQAAA